MTSVEKEQPRPRITKLIVKNFRCIGKKPVEIELDDIVVLVGPNNVGKSSIIRAYEIVMSEGSKEGSLSLEDFPNGKIDPDNLPEIELDTIIYDNLPGKEWIQVLENGENLIREKWIWADIGAPKRIGFNISKGRWANESDKEMVPWGMSGVANARRPQPHHIGAFDSPEKQTEVITEILFEILKERVSALKDKSRDEEKSDYRILLESVKEIQKKVVSESKGEITKVEDELTKYIEKIFPRHIIHFDARDLPPKNSYTMT